MIDLVCVDGRTNPDDVDNSFKAFMYSKSHGGSLGTHLNGHFFLSPIKTKKMEEHIHEFMWIQIRSLDYQQYSKFMLKDLYKTIDRYTCGMGSTHILTVQDDGFIVNPSLWNNEWMKYDYVAAPWPTTLIVPNEDGSNRVGNGGFSLRSYAFLKLVSEVIPWPNNPARMHGEALRHVYQGRYNPDWDLYNEDRIMCLWYSDVLKNLGMKFCPATLAIKFSSELPLHNDNGLTTTETFGFHGKVQHHTYYKPYYDLLNSFNL